MRLVILCEGYTEEAILKDFLAPYCTRFDEVKIINAKGSSNLIGGYKTLAETEIQARSDVIVFCLIDVYKAPFTYPKTVHQSAEPFLEQYAYIKQYMEEKIAPEFQENFFAFPVMMDIETWLLADVEGLNDYFKPRQAQRLSVYSSPETVTHPAKEIEKIWHRFKNRSYDKVLQGTRLFRRVQAERVYDDNCPHFEAIVNKLLKLQGLSVSKAEPQFEHPDAELYRQLAELQDQHDEILEVIIKLDEIDEVLYKEFEKIEANIKSLNEKVKEFYQSKD